VQTSYNYGYDGIEWGAAPDVGTKLRGHFWLRDVKPRDDSFLVSAVQYVEAEGDATPRLKIDSTVYWTPMSNFLA
jgi:hypothetical protein